MKKMNIDNVSSEEIVNLFEEAFESEIASFNNIGAFGITCDGREISKPVRILVDIVGHAGTPTIDQFRQGEVDNSKSISISRDDIGETTFYLLPNLTTFVSGNDYQVVYESE